MLPEKIPDVERILEIRQVLIESLFDQFSMIYEQGAKNTTSRIRLQGPEEYLEHGVMNYEAPRAATWLPRLSHGRKVAKLNDEQKRKSRKIERPVHQISTNVSAQQVYSTQFNATYLTDRAGEAEFLKLLHEEDHLAARTASLCAQLTHSIPLFTDLSLERVMQIRKEEHIAFESYRVTLSKIVKEHVASEKQLTPAEIKELFADVLEPEILNLEQRARNSRKSEITSSALGIGISAGVIALGAYTAGFFRRRSLPCAPPSGA